ncbi:hypothetical protein M413DRAFT_356857 [Hebeloma cylindrosporum]|uniref:Uncharacterized protein n=1 Tax=Hebeloma cylindrosporum TaxID=76867 RepID=A0A0C3CLF9_HEBCY|nr:hypothetical protein M413DRAFT_356857 [Hebeloma cylindrosporum h7]
MLCMNQHDPSAALVEDSIWAIASQAIADRQTDVQQDALTFICLRGGSFNDFCSILDDVFQLHKVVKNRGVLRLVRNSRQRVTQDPWHRRFWLWLTNSRKARGSTVFKRLFRQGQFHFATNDDLLSRSMLPV